MTVILLTNDYLMLFIIKCVCLLMIMYYISSLFYYNDILIAIDDVIFNTDIHSTYLNEIIILLMFILII